MKKTLVTLLAISGLTAMPAMAQDAEQLLQQKACVACHATDVQLVGPAYEAVAERYAGEENAVQTLVESITTGSKGKWGEIPMPPNNVTDEEATALAEWVLDQG